MKSVNFIKNTAVSYVLMKSEIECLDTRQARSLNKLFSFCRIVITKNDRNYVQTHIF